MEFVPGALLIMRLVTGNTGVSRHTPKRPCTNAMINWTPESRTHESHDQLDARGPRTNPVINNPPGRAVRHELHDQQVETGWRHTTSEATGADYEPAPSAGGRVAAARVTQSARLERSVVDAPRDERVAHRVGRAQRPDDGGRRQRAERETRATCLSRLGHVAHDEPPSAGCSGWSGPAPGRPGPGRRRTAAAAGAGAAARPASRVTLVVSVTSAAMATRQQQAAAHHHRALRAGEDHLEHGDDQQEPAHRPQLRPPRPAAGSGRARTPPATTTAATPSCHGVVSEHDRR